MIDHDLFSLSFFFTDGIFFFLCSCSHFFFHFLTLLSYIFFTSFPIPDFLLLYFIHLTIFFWLFSFMFSTSFSSSWLSSLSLFLFTLFSYTLSTSFSFFSDFFSSYIYFHCHISLPACQQVNLKIPRCRNICVRSFIPLSSLIFIFLRRSFLCTAFNSLPSSQVREVRRDEWRV